jgi:hypothetical protein
MATAFGMAIQRMEFDFLKILIVFMERYEGKFLKNAQI